MNKKYFLMLFMASILLVAACKKSKVEPAPGPDNTPADEIPPATSDRTEQTLDSIFLYAKQVYYWNNELPTYKVFNPRQYNTGSNALQKFENSLFGIASYSTNKYDVYKNSQGVYQNFPKFSYIDVETVGSGSSGYAINPMSSVELDGKANDIGLRFGFYGSETDYSIYVGAVYQNSPAEKQGFVRGDRVTKVNGVSYGSNYSAEYNALNAALSGTTVSLQGFKSDGTTPFNLTLTKASFSSNPIYKVKVLDAGAKKIGYLSYARFSDAANSIDTLNGTFKRFASAGVTDLIIDLRYNGGGYVATAEHLVNLIAPSTATGVMFTEHYNATMQAGNAKLLSKQFFWSSVRNAWVSYGDVSYSVANNTASFSKKGAVTNVRNVVFLVSASTASSSELVINCLRPHMNVTLVGRTTYGKPIGFFPITIDKKYKVYYSLFETKNSLGQGGYYTGMVPNYDLYELTAVKDGSGKTIGYKMVDFGDVQDVYLAKALEVLGATVTNNVATMSAAKSGTKNLVSSSNTIASELTDREFRGMIEDRFKLKN